MGGRHVLALDAGTSSARCFIFDLEGHPQASSAREWSYRIPEGLSSLAREFDPQAFWRVLCRLIGRAMKSAGLSPAEVAAVGVTSQRQGVVFLDRDGSELYAGPNLDLRAVFEGAAIDEMMGDRVHRVTGHLPSFLFTPAKLRWFQLHHPETYDRIGSVLTLADWVVWRLTSTLISEVTLAGEAGLLEVERRDWCRSLLNEMGIPSDILVHLGTAGTVAGYVSGKAAAQCGLAQGTPVALAGADTQCGLLGMGVVSEGDVGIVTGWSAPLQMVTHRPTFGQEPRTWTGCNLCQHTWVVESSPGDIGNAYRWLRDTLLGRGSARFQEMDALAQGVPAGSEGVTAVLGPPVMDAGRTGLRLGGFNFPVPLTFSQIGKGHLIRAALEGCAFAIKANLCQLEEVSGLGVKSISVGGGMVQTQTFVRILADVLGTPLRVSPIPQVSALGAALCAATAAGYYGSLEEAASVADRGLRTVEPALVHVEEYQEHYQHWLALSQGLTRLGL